MGASLTALAIVAALLVPTSATKKISEFGGTPDRSAPFVDKTAKLDVALATGTDLNVSQSDAKAALPALAIRRLATTGKLAADEIPAINEAWTSFDAQEAQESSPEGRRAVQQARHKAIAAKLPRFEPGTVERVLGDLVAQVDAIPDFGDGTEGSCQTCHVQNSLVAGAKTPDTVGIWPHFPPQVFSTLPVLQDTVETRAFKPDATCLGCHKPHGTDGFLTTVEQRRDSMGMWTHVYRIEDLLYVQVKVQNKVAAHMVPGGFLDRGYAVVVDAYEGAKPGGERLPFWSGHRLPAHLTADPDQSGYLMSRDARDEGGKPAGRSNATSIVDDTRLEPTRFVDLTFLYKIPRDRYVPYSVVSRLVYLPDQTTMKGGEDVEVRIRASE